ncbi:MAG: hypothetical protein Q4C45_10690 [Oscillospiraceae bacterium]|nr:hypothetical protein [Oscillospiraceae bacterium]
MDETRIERSLRAYLEEDERVLWRGTVKKFPLLAEDAGGLILVKWLGTLSAAAAIVTLYFRNASGRNPAAAALAAAVALCLMAAPVAERHRLLRQRYWITDRRAVLMTGNGTFYSMALEDAYVFRVALGDCLVLGRSLQETGQGQLRWLSCHPQSEQRKGCPPDRVDGMVFYRTDDAAGAQRLLRRGGAQ